MKKKNIFQKDLKKLPKKYKIIVGILIIFWAIGLIIGLSNSNSIVNSQEETDYTCIASEVRSGIRSIDKFKGSKIELTETQRNSDYTYYKQFGKISGKDNFNDTYILKFIADLYKKNGSLTLQKITFENGEYWIFK